MLSNSSPQAGHHQHKPLSLVCNSVLDKAPHLSIRIFIWILPSDIYSICQLNKNIIKTETAMLSTCVSVFLTSSSDLNVQCIMRYQWHFRVIIAALITLSK